MKIWTIGMIALAAPTVALAQPAMTGPAGADNAAAARDGNTAMTPADRKAESKARDALLKKGYTDVQNLTREGTDWTGQATFDGKTVDVRVSDDGVVRQGPGAAGPMR